MKVPRVSSGMHSCDAVRRTEERSAPSEDALPLASIDPAGEPDCSCAAARMRDSKDAVLPVFESGAGPLMGDDAAVDDAAAAKSPCDRDIPKLLEMARGGLGSTRECACSRGSDPALTEVDRFFIAPVASITACS